MANVLTAAASSAWVHRGFSLCKVLWGRTSRPFVFKCFKERFARKDTRRERTHVSLALPLQLTCFLLFLVFFFLFKKKCTKQQPHSSVSQTKNREPASHSCYRPSLWPPPCPALLRHRTFQTRFSVEVTHSSTENSISGVIQLGVECGAGTVWLISLLPQPQPQLLLLTLAGRVLLPSLLFLLCSRLFSPWPDTDCTISPLSVLFLQLCL